MEYSQHLKRICMDRSRRDDQSSRLKPYSTRPFAQRCRKRRQRYFRWNPNMALQNLEVE